MLRARITFFPKCGFSMAQPESSAKLSILQVVIIGGFRRIFAQVYRFFSLVYLNLAMPLAMERGIKSRLRGNAAPIVNSIRV